MPDQTSTQTPQNTPTPVAKPDAKPDAKPALTAAFISAPVILKADTDLIKAGAPRNARSAEQQAMDKVVVDLHRKWVAAGKPTLWQHMMEKECVGSYFSDPEHSAKLKQLINRAVALHELRAKYGTPTPVTAKLIAKYQLPTEYLGKEIIWVAILDKRTRETDAAAAKAAVAKAQATKAANAAK